MNDIIINEYVDHSERDLLLKIIENQHIMIGKFFLEFHLLNTKIEKIMSAQSDFATALEALKTEVDGIGTKVDALETALNNSGAVDPAVQAAFNDLKGSVDTLNTKADNVPATPPVTPAG